MHFKKSSILLIGLSLVCASSFAQDFKTSYFFRNTPYGYKINPAFMPGGEVDFFAGGLINNLSLTPQASFSMATLLFENNKKLVNGITSSNVADETLLEVLEDVYDGQIRMDESVFSLGRRGKNNDFFTLELNARSATNFHCPKEFIEYVKVGETISETTTAEDLRTNTRNYLELAAGYSRRISDDIALGGRFKLIGGLSAMDMNVNSLVANLNTVTGGVDVITDGTRWSSQGLVNLNGAGETKRGIKGFGAAIDLGVDWKLPVDGLSVNLGIQDLGFIYWKTTHNGELISQNIPLSGMLYPDDLTSTTLTFKEVAGASNKTEALSVTCNLGAKYILPVYDKIDFDFLASYRTKGVSYSSYFDLRLGVGYNPWKWFNVTTNFGYTKYGPEWGLALNFNAGPVNVFCGTDSMFFAYDSKGVAEKPVRSTLCAGITYTLRRK